MCVDQATDLGHQPFQLRVFFPQLPEFTQFAEAQPRKFPFPHGGCLLHNPNFRQTSLPVVPPFACRKAARICSSVCPHRRAIV